MPPNVYNTKKLKIGVSIPSGGSKINNNDSDLPVLRINPFDNSIISKKDSFQQYGLFNQSTDFKHLQQNK